jgi:hypothetical protein
LILDIDDEVRTAREGTHADVELVSSLSRDLAGRVTTPLRLSCARTRYPVSAGTRTFGIPTLLPGRPSVTFRAV